MYRRGLGSWRRGGMGIKGLEIGFDGEERGWL